MHRRTDVSPVAEHFNGRVHLELDMTVMVIELYMYLPAVTHVHKQYRRTGGSEPWRVCSLLEWISGLTACETLTENNFERNVFSAKIC